MGNYCCCASPTVPALLTIDSKILHRIKPNGEENYKKCSLTINKDMMLYGIDNYALCCKCNLGMIYLHHIRSLKFLSSWTKNVNDHDRNNNNNNNNGSHNDREEYALQSHSETVKNCIELEMIDNGITVFGPATDTEFEQLYQLVKDANSDLVVDVDFDNQESEPLTSIIASDEDDTGATVDIEQTQTTR